jgi:hypothetical protein
MTEFEKNCYGMSESDIRLQYITGITVSSMEMAVMGILSDCQEMIAMKHNDIPTPYTDEYVRKHLNRAKFILSEMIEAKELA